MAPAATEDYVGLSPDTFVEGGGGLVDDIDVVITSCRAENFQYVTKLGEDKGSAPAIVLKATPVDKSLKAIQEVYTVGTKVQPSKDGTGFTRLPGMTTGGINKQSKGGVFLERAQAVAGCPSFAPPAGLSSLEGKTVHMIRIPTPKYGADKSGKQVGKADGTMLVISAFLSEQKGSKGAPSADIADEATGVILSILQEQKDGKLRYPDGVSKTKLNQLVFSALDGNPNRREINAYALSDACLKGADAPWSFDGKVITLPE
jgi:hypothetical protein